MSAARPPHIVFVLVDDLGFHGVGYRNRDLHTPTIDALAASGVISDVTTEKTDVTAKVILASAGKK